MALNLCKIEGCGKNVHGRGYCDAHYYRLLKHGDPLGGGTQVGAPQRFLEKALAYEGDDCLCWPYGHNGVGYGQINLRSETTGRKRPHYVHRMVCEAANGPPPTPKHEAAHSCGRGHEGCITKRHLSWKTSTENKADTRKHGNTAWGERNGHAKLTLAQVREIRKIKNLSQREIAARYGVASATIWHVRNNSTWREADTSSVAA